MSTLQCNFPQVRNFFREIFLRRRFSQKYSQKFKKSEEFTNPLSFSISSTITNILALNFARIFNLIRLFFIENQLGQLFKVIKAYRITWIFHCCNVTRCLFDRRLLQWPVGFTGRRGKREECNYAGHILPVCVAVWRGGGRKSRRHIHACVIMRGSRECTREIRARVPRRPINRTHFDTKGISRACPRESSKITSNPFDREENIQNGSGTEMFAMIIIRTRYFHL